MFTKMKRRIIGLLALTLLLSGCVKQEYTATVNADGSLSGVQSSMLPETLWANEMGYYEALYYAQAIPAPYPISNVSYANFTINEGVCIATNVRIDIDESISTSFSPTFANIRFDTPNKSNTVFGSGYITNSVDNGTDSYFEIAELTLNASSGNNSDCNYISTIDEGVIAITSQTIIASLGNQDLNTSILQLANINGAERIHYLMATQFLGNDDPEYLQLYPENLKCNSDLQKDLFDELNFRQHLAGEFLNMLREETNVDVVRDDAGLRVSCQFESVPLPTLNRTLNEETSPPQESFMGYWRASEDGLSWNYSATMNKPALTEEFTEFPLDGDYTRDEVASILLTQETGEVSKFVVTGVILSSNGNLNLKENSVSWQMGGSNEVPVIAPEGAFGEQFPTMQVVHGYPVTFKSKKSVWSNSATFGGLKSRLTLLKKSGIGSIRIVGIKESGLSGAAAKQNLKIVTQRVKEIKAKLAAAKIRVPISVVYLTPESVLGGDPNSKNKVVVQVVRVG